MKLNKLLFLTLVPFTLSLAYDIYPQVSAKITFIEKENTDFKKGDLLVTFDQAQIDTLINKEKAKLEYLKTLLEDKELTLTQDNELYESTVLPKKELDKSNLEYKLAKANFDAQKATLEFYIIEKKKYSIYAPFNGKVNKVVEPRDSTNISNAKPLLTLEAK